MTKEAGILASSRGFRGGTRLASREPGDKSQGKSPKGPEPAGQITLCGAHGS